MRAVTFRPVAGLFGKENEMVYPAKVTELKRLSPHASVEMKRTPATAGPRPR